MKKIFFVICMLGFAITGSSQGYQWENYRIDLPYGMVFAGGEWHYNTGSVIETNVAHQYVFIKNNGRSQMVYIPPYKIVNYNRPYRNMDIYFKRPYSRGSGTGAWFVATSHGNFLVSARNDGYVTWRLTSVMYYGDDYVYNIRRSSKTLVFVDWHLCSDDYRRVYYKRYAPPRIKVAPKYVPHYNYKHTRYYKSRPSKPVYNDKRPIKQEKGPSVDKKREERKSGSRRDASRSDNQKQRR